MTTPKSCQTQQPTATPPPEILATFSWLIKTFPKLFSQSAALKQLKIGIFDDIVAAKKASRPSRQWLKRTLRYYTGSPHYLALQTAGTPRFDLDGQVAGEITDLQAIHAVKRFKRFPSKQRKEAMEAPLSTTQ